MGLELTDYESDALLFYPLRHAFIKSRPLSSLCFHAVYGVSISLHCTKFLSVYLLKTSYRLLVKNSNSSVGYKRKL